MDYIFYRVYQFYSKRDDIPFTTALCFVIVIYASVGFFIGNLVNTITEGFITYKHFEKDVIRYTWLIVLLLLSSYYIYRYKKVCPPFKLHQKYKDSLLNSRIRMWHIFMIPVVVILLSLVNIYIYKAFKY